ncbi:secretion protein HlyD [Oceaniovalibus guishaninsula JLT2003]|uniref:Secretion protein HlyD n=1 Tax=Oceaniovalibus guishaninsula JLT2003 TaxID=1231392 RepID=K2HLG8_9RHOB|nr:HlyD family efflux transporter periplasmic adaptor subunit [Oceaniovalibus guishaninsula]EKE43729.1 secretion protein HlyD [Oceaniovalibus guishaninsula JLT2003]
MHFLRRALTGLFLLAATVGLLAYGAGLFLGALQDRAAREDRPSEARERIFAANVVTVAPETLVPVMTGFGTVESRRTLELRAADRGRVVALGEGVEEGARVQAGQLLFRLDPADARQAVAVARTDLQDAHAELDDAIRAVELAADDLAGARSQADLRQRALDRQRDLESRGVGTSAAVEDAELAAAAARQAVVSRRQAEAAAEARRAQAETRIARAEIALDEAQRNLDETEVTAAFDGILSEVDVVAGRLVSAGERLADLIDPEALEVAFTLSTAEYARLLDESGQLTPAALRVFLEVEGFVLESPGIVTRESGAVGAGQSGRRVFARLTEPGGFRPGDFVRVAIEEPALDRVARLPASAVDPAGGVLVLGDDERLRPAFVEVLRQQGDDVLVRADDLAGREVVAARTPLLGDGIRVRPVRRDDDAALAEPDLLDLTEERRARLVAFVQANDRMPQEAKDRVLAQLREPRVPAGVVERIEGRM